jgi:hypothetical protein
VSTPRTLGFGWLALIAAAGCTQGPIGIASLPSNGLLNNLIAHWTFDEGTLFTAGDTSGNDRNGLVTGNNWNWIDDGRFGGGLHLGGNDAFGGGSNVTVGGFPQATPSFTVSVWYRLATTDITPALGEIVALLSNEILGGGGWAINLALPPPPGNNDANFHFTYWIGPVPPPEGSVRPSCPCLVEDRWTHIAAVVDAVLGGPGTVTLYIDGVERARADVPVPIPRGLPTLYIGRWSGAGRFLTGDLDDIAIWSRALVAAEIALLTNNPAPNQI